MTKSLTEQWKDGELDSGYYYLKMKDKEVVIDHTEYIFWAKEIRWENKDHNYVKEVLAPVPSYDEWHKVKDLGLRPDYTDHIEKWEDCARLTKKLEIATKALKRYSKDDYYSEGGGRSVNPYPHIARKALKEMEGVK